MPTAMAESKASSKAVGGRTSVSERRRELTNPKSVTANFARTELAAEPLILKG